jgi:DNA-binding LacI/PurR family transcriptional regulator
MDLSSEKYPDTALCKSIHLIPKYLKPIYLQIASELERRILTGEIPTLTRVPPCKQFSKTHKVTQATMHKALAHLSKGGFLKRYKKRGTFVTTPIQKNIIGIVFGCNPLNIESIFFVKFLESLRNVFEKNGILFDYHYNLQLEHFNLALNRLEQEIASKRYRFIIPLSISRELMRWMKVQSSVPVLLPKLIPRNVITGKCCALEPVKSAVLYLLKRGFRRILVVTMSPISKDPTQKATVEEEGVKAAYDEFGESMPQNIIQFWGFKKASGYIDAQKLFSQDKSLWPDALFINHDVITQGALLALSERNIKIPNDIVLLTHSHVGQQWSVSIPLTRLEYNTDELALNFYRGLPSVGARIAPIINSIRIEFPWRLEIGSSCGEKIKKLKI